jgi:hypothetical protein
MIILRESQQCYQHRKIKRLLHLLASDLSMKMIVFWDVVPCSLVDIDRRFRGAYCLHHHPDDVAVIPS